jgi:hypothetical protein
MSRLAGFYIAKVVESAAASSTPRRRAGDHAAPDAIRAHGRGRSASRRVAAALRHHVWRLGYWVSSSSRWERERERA